MPKTNVYGTDGKEKGTMDLPESLFGLVVRRHHLWRGVTTHLSRQRLGTVSTKSKGEVSGGGKKPFRQKGTGNARQGSTRAVQFVGGGIAHGPKPRDYSLELPKKMRRQILAESLSDKAQQGKLRIVDNLNFDAAKTKSAVAFLKNLGVDQTKCLVILDGSHEATLKSFRNIPAATVKSRENLNAYDVINHEMVVFTKGALEKFVSLAAGESSKTAEKAK